MTTQFFRNDFGSSFVLHGAAQMREITAGVLTRELISLGDLARVVSARRVLKPLVLFEALVVSTPESRVTPASLTQGITSTMVAIRIGTGELNDFNIWVDADWPTLPRVGENVIFDDGKGGTAVHAVRQVAYQVGADHALIGALVLI